MLASCGGLCTVDACSQPTSPVCSFFGHQSVHILSNAIGLYTTAMTSVILKVGACNVGTLDLLNNDL